MTSEPEKPGKAQAQAQAHVDAPADGPAGAPADGPAPGAYDDRCYRSAGAMAGGVLLLALGVWLGGDAMISGSGRIPWISLAGLVLAVPLVVAFTLRPAVFAGERRMRVRNPFRTITVPWGAVESVRAGYSNEVVADGTKYQLWAIPVSLRARKKATRHNERLASGYRPDAVPRGGGGFLGMGFGAGADEVPVDGKERRAPSDQAVDELRALAERHGESEPAQGRVVVRWAYEILAPAAAGVVALALLLGTR